MLIPYQKGYPIVQPQLEALHPAAEAAGVTLIEAPAADAAELDAILQAQVQPDGAVNTDAILFLAEPLAVTPDAFAVMGAFAYEHQLPIGGALIAVEDYRSVFGVNVEVVASGKLAAPIADKILKGTPPREIPVVSADNYIEIDYKAAQDLGLVVPESLLLEADRVIR
jgi:putative ABC transport system substrate-binding protein